MPVDSDLHYDFSYLLDCDRRELLADLAATHSAVANLAVQIAFLKQEEARQADGARLRRLEAEGLQAAFVEKKWLIKALLDG